MSRCPRKARSRQRMARFLDWLQREHACAFELLTCPAVGFSIPPSFALEDDESDWWLEPCETLLRVLQDEHGYMPEWGVTL